MFTRRGRAAPAIPAPPKARDVAGWILRDPESLDDDEKAKLSHRDPGLRSRRTLTLTSCRALASSAFIPRAGCRGRRSAGQAGHRLRRRRASHRGSGPKSSRHGARRSMIARCRGASCRGSRGRGARRAAGGRWRSPRSVRAAIGATPERRRRYRPCLSTPSRHRRVRLQARWRNQYGRPGLAGGGVAQPGDQLIVRVTPSSAWTRPGG